MLRRRRTLIEGGVLLVTLGLLRAPSLVEPPWAADEGAYANIGRSLRTSSWVYALAACRPAARFVWMNSADHLYRGAEPLLVADLRARPPAVLLADQPLTAELRTLLTGRGYALIHDPGGDCWLAPWAPG